MRYGLRPVAGGRSFGLAAQQTEVAEELGFDGVFFGEHHGFPDYWPSPVLALTALARSTTRIRLGASVLILPLHHPVRLAEELAMLDCLSDGRLVVGLGQGWASHEFDAFSVPRPQLGEIFTEGVSLLKRLWASQPTTFHGSFYSLKAYTISPAVVQEPHPPIWLGGNAPSAIRRAAALADGWLCGDIETIEELAKGMAVYEAALQDVGRKEPVTVFPAGRHIVLAASSRQAWQEAEEIAAISDSLLLPDRVSAALRLLRGD